MKKRCMPGILLVPAMSLLAGISCAAAPIATSMAPELDGQTLLLLQVDKTTNRLVDRRGAFQPTVKGAAVVTDEQRGPCLEFGAGSGNEITVEDKRGVDFSGGFTLEMSVLVKEQPEAPNPGGSLAVKDGSFSLSLGKTGKLNNDWMVFPSMPVFTSTKSQFDYYPVDSETFYGKQEIPKNRWVRVAATYDPVTKVIRTWIDGSLDRTRYLWREGDAPLLSKAGGRFSFLQGMTHVRVTDIRVSNTARALGDIPVLEAYVQPLPYRGQVAVTLDHLERAPLPLDVTFMWELPVGDSRVVKRLRVTERKPQNILFDTPGWKGSLNTLSIKAYAGHREVFSRDVRVPHAKPQGRVSIDQDRALVVNGRKTFPLVIYHAFKEDFPVLSQMGFNIVVPRSPSLRFFNFSPGTEQEVGEMRAYLDAAVQNNLLLMMPGNSGALRSVTEFRNHPGLAAWYGFDEPYGTLERVRDSYNMVKLLDPHLPIFNVQNNLSRMQETGEGSDIIACDPYPVPNVSMRWVADSTKATIRAVGGLKPAWTIVCQYGEKRPTVQELRCMLYLGIVSGADGLGVYAWDDRRDRKTGWYTAEHAEDKTILAEAIGELSRMENILLIPNAARKISISPANPALHAAIKEAADARYLFVVNDSRREESGTVTVEGLAKAEGVELQNATQKIQFHGGQAVLRLPPLGVRVIKLPAG